MRVIVIRHGKVDFKWRGLSTSEQFDMDCMKYDKAPVKPFSVEIPKKVSEKIYISSLPRSRESAIQIFGEKNFIVTSLINEVPMRASIVSKIKLPLWFWNISGRLQWFFHSRMQQEGKIDTVKRAEKFVRMILRSEEDCTVVTHGFFMHTLIAALKKNGFCISHARVRYSNGECIIAEWEPKETRNTHDIRKYV